MSLSIPPTSFCRWFQKQAAETLFRNHVATAEGLEVVQPLVADKPVVDPAYSALGRPSRRNWSYAVSSAWPARRGPRPGRRLVYQRPRARQPRALGRRDIVPEKSFRGRSFWNHRQKLVGGMLDDWTVQGESGLAQRPEPSWRSTTQTSGDEKQGPNDRCTAAARVRQNVSLSVEANGQINDFFTETQWLPRGDFYWLGESLIDNQTTLYSHLHRSRTQTSASPPPPTNPTVAEPVDAAALGKSTASVIPTIAHGERFVMRNELTTRSEVTNETRGKFVCIITSRQVALPAQKFAKPAHGCQPRVNRVPREFFPMYNQRCYRARSRDCQFE